ncbi:hypothetical protein, partial [Bartonella bacilliformis]
GSLIVLDHIDSRSSMRHPCYGIKYFKQQEILVIFSKKKVKIITNLVKMKKFRQKILNPAQFEAILF